MRKILINIYHSQITLNMKNITSTTEVPSRNLVRNNTLALLNIPSLSDTTINCDPLNRVRSNCPIFCVCEGSSAASTSSSIYIGAGLNCNNDNINDKAISDLSIEIIQLISKEPKKQG